MSSNCGIASYQKIPCQEGILIIIWGKNVILQQSDHLTYLFVQKTCLWSFKIIYLLGQKINLSKQSSFDIKSIVNYISNTIIFKEV